jgi:molecular chaperone GrpE
MTTLIEAVDDLERALEAARAGGASPAWLEGIELVANRLREGLARHGVAAIDPLGEPFDPRLHEALLEIDAPPGARPGDVVQVVLRGYRRGDRALRAARVVVARRTGEGASG